MDESDATNNRKDTETSLIASLKESGTEFKRKNGIKKRERMGTEKMRTENQSDRMTDLPLSSEDGDVYSLFSGVVQEGDTLSARTGAFRAEG